MPIQLIGILLWIPFALVVAVAGVIFCISGYKKGVWRALIALGATIVAALISLLLARVLSALIAPELVALVPVEELAGSGLPVNLITDMANGFVKMAVALVLFPIFMLILTIILRIISYHIRKDKLQPTKKSRHWLGMAVGAVSAVVYTLLLLVPLYGTLGAYMPTVQTLLSLQSEDDSRFTPYLKAVTSHPVVAVSGTGPVSALYSGLSTMEIGEASLDIPRMARTMEETMLAVEAVVNADGTDRVEKVKELVDILRYDVAEQAWFYELAQEGIQQFRQEIPADASGPEVELVTAFLDVLDCPREAFGKNCAAIFDFMAYALEQDVITIFENEDVDALYESGIIAEAGKLANFSEEAVEVKKLLLSVFLITTQDAEPDLDSTMAYLEDLGVGQTTDPAAQEKEAEAILLLMGMDSATEADIIMRHPNMGEPVLQERIAELGFAEALGIEDPTLTKRINSDPALQELCMDTLRQCAQRPLGTVTFRDYLRELELVSNFAATGDYSYGASGDPDTYLFALEVLGEEAFRKGNMGKVGPAVYIFFRTLVRQVQANPDAIRYETADGGSRTENYMQTVKALTDIMWVARRGKLPTSRAEAEMSEYIDLEYCLQQYLFHESGYLAIRKLVESNGTDPLNITGYMSYKQKQTIGDLLDWMTSDEYITNATQAQLQELAEKASWLKKYFAIS